MKREKGGLGKGRRKGEDLCAGLDGMEARNGEMNRAS